MSQEKTNEEQTSKELAKLIHREIRDNRESLAFMNKLYWSVLEDSEKACLLSRRPLVSKHMHDSKATQFFDYLMQGLKSGHIKIIDSRID